MLGLGRTNGMPICLPASVASRVRFAASLILLCVLPSMYVAAQNGVDAPSRPLVIEVRLENAAITPITARFIRRAISMAEEQRAECLVIVLDTTGGLVDSTREVVKDILGSEVPVVVYVAPSGARAASAGVFITMASHVSAMAPGTNDGPGEIELNHFPICCVMLDVADIREQCPN